MDDATYYALRERMVQEQLMTRGIESIDVLDAMRRVPRHEFIPTKVQQFD